MDLFQNPMKIPTILYKACNDDGIAVFFYGFFHDILHMPCKCNESRGISATFFVPI